MNPQWLTRLREAYAGQKAVGQAALFGLFPVRMQRDCEWRLMWRNTQTRECGLITTYHQDAMIPLLTEVLEEMGRLRTARKPQKTRRAAA